MAKGSYGRKKARTGRVAYVARAPSVEQIHKMKVADIMRTLKRELSPICMEIKQDPKEWAHHSIGGRVFRELGESYSHELILKVVEQFFIQAREERIARAVKTIDPKLAEQFLDRGNGISFRNLGSYLEPRGFHLKDQQELEEAARGKIGKRKN